MELTTEQRTWLEKAIQQKGRFTTKKTIKKQLKDYISRRGKTALGFAGIEKDHPQYKTIQDGLAAADKLANSGDLKSAYSTLNNIKAIAKGAAAGRATLIQVDAIRRDTDLLSRDAGVAVELKKEAIGSFDNLLATVEVHAKASDLDTFEKAIAFRKKFVDDETRFRGLYKDSADKCEAAKADIFAFNITSRLANLFMDISAMKSAGHEKDVAAYEAKCLQIQKAFKNDKHLNLPATIPHYPTDKKNVAAFEGAILACKSLAKWQKRDDKNATADASTDTIRGGLNRDDEARLALIKKEEERLQRARDEIKRQSDDDKDTFEDTSKGQINITPVPAKFDPGETLDGLVGEVMLGDEVSEEQANAIAKGAAKRVRDFLSDVKTDKEKLFDLSIKKRSDLLEMIALETLGTTNPDDWTDSQKAMLEKAATEAEKAICQNLPNKLSDDGTKINVGGKEYKNPIVLKEGGNGKTTLYTDDNGKTIVLKTLLSDAEYKRDEMIWEMQTHYRAMQGADDDSAIVGFHGAARSENGQMHMVLESVDGGDLEDRNKALSAAASSGLIPDEARQAIAMNDLLKTVKALKELEKQGLVHRDIKGENIMMTKDGKVKIIDFGESDFLDDSGVIGEGKAKGTTSGYEAKEVVIGEEHDTKADTHAVSGLLQRLVADMMPNTDFNEAKMESGSLGRLVAALSDPDPKKRPSLDAILQSSMAKSYENDFNPENVKDLQDASLEFTLQMTSLKGEIDVEDLKTKVSEDTAKGLKTPMKAKDIQSLITFLEKEISDNIEEFKKDKELFLSGGKETLAALQKDIAVLKGQAIKPMVDAAVKGGETAYQDALKDPGKTVEIVIGGSKKKMTLGKAVEARDQLNTRLMDNRTKVMEALNGREESQDLQVKLDTYNKKITLIHDTIKAVDDVIYATVGPEAKFFLSKVKMDKASAAFGSVGNPASEKGVKDESGLDQLVTGILKEDNHDEIKRKATS